MKMVYDYESKKINKNSCKLLFDNLYIRTAQYSNLYTSISVINVIIVEIGTRRLQKLVNQKKLTGVT